MVAAFGVARRPAWLSLNAAERAVSAVGDDVASLLPDRWKRKLLPHRKIVLLDMPRDGKAIDALLPDGRSVAVGGSHDPSDLRKAAARSHVALRIDDAEILSTVLKLPRRAAARLDEVVATNIPVWTPFTAGDLYFSARVVDGQAAGGSGTRRPICDVELRCVPRAALAPRLSVLAGCSIEVDELWLGEDRSFSCDLGSRKTRVARRRRRATLAFAALAVVQTFALSTVYRMHQDRRIAVLQGDLDRLRTAVHARAVRVRADQNATRILSAIEARATGRESMVVALKQLASVLPTGARYREINITSTGDGSLTIVSGDRIDPVSLVAATGLLAVTEVNEMNGAQDSEHVYAVAFKAVRAAPVPD